MSTMRLRRLEKLERRQSRTALWRDPNDAAAQLWAALEASADAESASRPFSWLPSVPLSSGGDFVRLRILACGAGRTCTRRARNGDNEVYQGRRPGDESGSLPHHRRRPEGA